MADKPIEAMISCAPKEGPHYNIKLSDGIASEVFLPTKLYYYYDAESSWVREHSFQLYFSYPDSEKVKTISRSKNSKITTHYTAWFKNGKLLRTDKTSHEEECMIIEYN